MWSAAHIARLIVSRSQLPEMGRRFVLVGLFVVTPYKRGTMMQLSLAVLCSTLYLVMQIICRPYKTYADNFLAIACSTTLVVALIGCVLFKYDVLLKAEQIQLRMGPARRFFYNLDTSALTTLLLVMTAGALVLAALLLLVQMARDRKEQLRAARSAKARRLRWNVDKSEVVLHPPQLNLPAPAPTDFEPTYAMGAVSDRFHIFLSQCAVASPPWRQAAHLVTQYHLAQEHYLVPHITSPHTHHLAPISPRPNTTSSHTTSAQHHVSFHTPSQRVGHRAGPDAHRQAAPPRDDPRRRRCAWTGSEPAEREDPQRLHPRAPWRVHRVHIDRVLSPQRLLELTLRAWGRALW